MSLIKNINKFTYPLRPFTNKVFKFEHGIKSKLIQKHNNFSSCEKCICIIGCQYKEKLELLNSTVSNLEYLKITYFTFAPVFGGFCVPVPTTLEQPILVILGIISWTGISFMTYLALSLGTNVLINRTKLQIKALDEKYISSCKNNVN